MNDEERAEAQAAHLEAVTVTSRDYGRAREDRDRAIRNAVARGCSRHEVALRAGLSRPRVDQLARGVRRGDPVT